MAGSGTAHLRDGVLLRVNHLDVVYPGRGGVPVPAVSDVSLDIRKGETLGLVGESGCGKSTVGKSILRHMDPTGGEVLLGGQNVLELSASALRQVRSRLQMVFQDPVSSLNPRRSVEKIIGQGLDTWGTGTRAEREAKVKSIMEAVGLVYDPASKRRRHEFSGGQCQRISIARALVMDPELLVCDEAVSALDVSVQAQILNLLLDLREQYDLTMLFIAHNLSVVKYVSDRVAVMYLGKLCEVGSGSAVVTAPRHPYTRALLDSVPNPAAPAAATSGSNAPVRVGGEPHRPLADHMSTELLQHGCRFRDRCPRAQDTCAKEEPVMREVGPDQFVACHFPLDAASSASGSARLQEVGS